MFNQSPPQLGNQFDDDPVLRSYLARALPPEVYGSIESELKEMGAMTGGPLYQFQLADRKSEPVHTPWDAWGNRIDQIELTPLWRAAEPLAARSGLIAIPYERQHGAWSRVHQFALVYLFTPSTDVYSCPLAMTDGAARTLSISGNQALAERALPHMTSRDPKQFWTSGQWMTESTGGSDVGLSETTARQDSDGRWRLYGRKWFTSAIGSQMALTLARPDGNPRGGKGLALFYLEVRDEAGKLNGIAVNRLKDKLGTRKVPTAELTLDGAIATPVIGLGDGVKNIAPMLNVTRTWNSVTSAAYMRRAIALARDYASRRFAFGSMLSEKPLHLETLAGMQTEFEAAFHLTFFLVELLGKTEAGAASESEGELLRLLTPIVKLTTAKQCVAVCSEALECFGGAGYVEDTGLPALLRDAQVLPIWEGTTNVLALDALRAAHGGNALHSMVAEVAAIAGKMRDSDLKSAVTQAREMMESARRMVAHAPSGEQERNARRIALTLGRSLALALLCAQAQWSLDSGQEPSSTAAARRFRIADLGGGLV
ncbi:MAG: acyl-CoA dehydrogenase [Betaproteobacteria bacterium]|nr:acyl-CoA dehydrogenase [Betaproteobacteria bacterium]